MLFPRFNATLAKFAGAFALLLAIVAIGTAQFLGGALLLAAALLGLSRTGHNTAGLTGSFKIMAVYGLLIFGTLVATAA